eukprot:12038081-Prorocentrum_lima.AAC.1
MTSSLVGSEMCIRDRHSNRVGVAASWQKCSTSFRLITVGEIARDLGGDAVSYTHLTLPTICSV